VELGLRVLWDKPDPAAELPHVSTYRADGCDDGRSYLLALVEQERQMGAQRGRAESLADELEAPLLEMTAAHVRRCLETPRMLLTGAYLVDRDKVEAFRRRVEALQEARPELGFLCTGPWPAYSFVSPLDGVRREEAILR
jgi:hypothetical protein